MKSDLECPVDFVSVNENKVRLTALFVLLLAIAFTVWQHWIIPAFLVVDFFSRAFNLGKFSLLNLVSGALVSFLNIRNKPTDLGPKRFAAKIGFIFCAIILLLSLFKVFTAALAFAGIIILFAFLESAFGFCAGCYMYTFYKRLAH